MSKKNSLKKLIVILGPTASGKSELALKLAKKYNGEIINADSRQIYKEMYIGTGSPILHNSKHGCHSELVSESIIDFRKNNTMQNNQKVLEIKTGQNVNQKKILELNSRQALKQVQDDKSILIDRVPHHLLHIKNPNQKFSLSQYKKLAVKIIRDIHRRNKLPILVGGTGLYISAIVDNLEIPKAPPNKKIREKLERHSRKYLFARLSKIDPKSAKVIGLYNKRKLIRALEVYEITGKPFSAQQIKGKPLFDILQIGIKIDREKLYKKIGCRVDEMIKNGLVEETEKLIKKYSSDLPAMTEIGYKEIGLYLAGKTSLKETSQLIKFRTHHYARRQMTWFKRDERIRWINGYREAKKATNDFLKK